MQNLLTPEIPELVIEDWGVLPFAEALDGQLQVLEQIHSNNWPGVIGFCQHPPVVTVGSKAQASEYCDWQGEVVNVSRGGRVTYHGPEQLMIYPLINLSHPSFHKDLDLYLRSLENWLLETLKQMDICAFNKNQMAPADLARARAQSAVSEAETEVTGIWTGGKKIASLGIGIRKWITFQGASLNVNASKNFDKLTPCGFLPSTMTSMSEVTGATWNVKAVQNQLTENVVTFTRSLMKAK